MASMANGWPPAFQAGSRKGVAGSTPVGATSNLKSSEMMIFVEYGRDD